MEITHQPSTIGEMSPQNFQTIMVNIIKDTVHEVTGARFDVIEQRLDKIERRLNKMTGRLDHLETDSIQITDNIIDLGNAVAELNNGQLRTDENFEQVRDMFYMNQTRFDHMERDIIRHDRQLEELAV